MDDRFTVPPWYSDVAGIIYAVNARAGQTTIATLHSLAPAALLAAAPDLLQALEDAIECLEQEFGRLQPGARRNAVLEARNGAYTATRHARNGGGGDNSPIRHWVAHPSLPIDERKANERLLDAAEGLLDAATKAYGALASYVVSPAVSALQEAIRRARS